MVKNIATAAFAALALLFALSSCDQSDLGTPVDFSVKLDSENTYVAGESVRFNFSGTYENIVFFSGEDTHKYKYKERYQLSPEDVKSASLNLTLVSQYGHDADTKSAMDIYVSDSFDGLNGFDYEADMIKLNAMVDAGLPGWELIDTVPGKIFASSRTIEFQKSYPLDGKYIAQFSLAFHYHPNWDTDETKNSWKKFCYFSGDLSLELFGASPSKQDIRTLNYVGIVTNNQETFTNPYGTVAWNGLSGGYLYDYPGKGSIAFVGGKNAISGGVNDLDLWMISAPITLNMIDPDTGETIKGFIDYMDSYDYTFEEPGTYTVSFVASNASHLGVSQVVKEVTVTIVDKF